MGNCIPLWSSVHTAFTGPKTDRAQSRVSGPCPEIPAARSLPRLFLFSTNCSEVFLQRSSHFRKQMNTEGVSLIQIRKSVMWWWKVCSHQKKNNQPKIKSSPCLFVFPAQEEFFLKLWRVGLRTSWDTCIVQAPCTYSSDQPRRKKKNKEMNLKLADIKECKSGYFTLNFCKSLTSKVSNLPVKVNCSILHQRNKGHRLHWQPENVETCGMLSITKGNYEILLIIFSAHSFTLQFEQHHSAV